MCDKAVDTCPFEIDFPGWYFTSNMIEKLDSNVFSNNDIVFGKLDSDFVTFFSNAIGLNSITLYSINLDDDNFDDCDPETICHVRLTAWYNRYKQRKASKKDRWRIIAYSMASNKSVALSENEKRKKNMFDWWKVIINFRTVSTNIKVSRQIEKY